MHQLTVIRLGTSCFAKAWEVPCPVSIARSEPAWFKHSCSFRVYKRLAPSWRLIQKSKQGKIYWQEYQAEYHKEVLDVLDPEQVLQELIQTFGPEQTLLCWERKHSFCHRRLVARWLSSKCGLEIPEIDL
ncbi:MAG: DUF488 family protein [Desulfohalobiaceae bacterium]